MSLISTTLSRVFVVAWQKSSTNSLPSQPILGASPRSDLCVSGARRPSDMNRTVGYLIGAGLILSCSAWTAEAKNHKPHNRHAVVRAYPYRDPGAITPQDRRSLPPGLAKRNRLPP